MIGPLPGDSFQPGDLLNNTYRIEAILGRGGTSEVYRARSEISGRVVAIKALRAEFSGNDDYLVLMTREEDIREISNSAIVRYSDTQRTDGGHVYLVMEYVDGPGLDAKLKQGGMSAEDLLTIARRVAEGLVAAHGKNIVHRDLSPDNIILRGGNPHDAVIIDFGIAKDTTPGAATIVGNDFAGKYAYAAPEQLGGQTDARSDLYALGALLLATFRGRQPDPGANPMEVVQKKSLPLDTASVPEPLKSLIDRLSAPQREDRFQSAVEVLEFLHRSAGGIPAGGLEDRTVIAPRPAAATTTPPPPRQTTTTPAAPTTGIPKPAPVAPPGADKPRGKGGLIAAGLVALLALAGGGAWVSGALDGVIGARLAHVSPYTLTLAGDAEGLRLANGHVPDATLQQALSALATERGGTATLELASGDLAPEWGAGLQQLLSALGGVPEWRLAVEDNRVALSGLAADRGQRDTVLRALQAIPAALQVSPDLGVGPRLLQASALAPLLQSFGDCGELRLIDPPAAGYPLGARITVAGNLSSTGSRVGLADAVAAVAGDRPVDVIGDVLNPALCKVDLALPKAPPGGIEILFGFGDRPDINADGRYFVGENPVIDLVIPEQITDGFIFVSALDVSGNVFHMLPNLLNEENSVAAIRNGATGPFKLRVAFAEHEVQNGDRLAFVVDDKGLGKSRILVIHASEQIFGGIRPTTESVEAYAEALRARSGPVDVLDSRILTTVAKP